MAAKSPQTDHEVKLRFAAATAALQKLVDSAETAQPQMKFDQMIAEDNATGQAIVRDSIARLVELTRAIESAAKVIGIENLSPETADHSF